MVKKILPGQIIGIIGGNEIGKAMGIAAKNMGFQVGLLDPDLNAVASGICDFQIQGEYDDEASLEEMATRCHVLTYAIETIPPKSLRHLQGVVDLPQSLDLLEITQDRLLEKTYLEANNVVIAPYATIINITDIQDAIEGIGYPCVLKRVEKNNEEKGRLMLYSPADLKKAVPMLRFGPCVLEAWIPKEKQLTVHVFGNDKKEYEAFPPVEVMLKNERLHEAIIPGRISLEVENEAKKIALNLAENISLVGGLTIEFFVGKLGFLYVNELHPILSAESFIYTDTCSFSAATEHIRGLCNWSLGKNQLLSSGVMVSILGKEQFATEDLLDDFPLGNFYYYGKLGMFEEEKIGHITIVTKDIYQTLEDIYQTKIW